MKNTILKIVGIKKEYNTVYQNDFSLIIKDDNLTWNIEIITNEKKIDTGMIIDKLLDTSFITHLVKNEVYNFDIKYKIEGVYEDLFDLSNNITIATDEYGKLIAFNVISKKDLEDDEEINLDLNSLYIKISQGNELVTNYNLDLVNDNENKVYSFHLNSTSEKICSFDILRKFLNIIINNKEYENGVYKLSLNMEHKFNYYVINNSFIKFEVKNSKLVRFNVMYF